MAMLIDGQNIETLLAALDAAGGGTLDVPAGVHTGFFVTTGSNVRIRGVGMRATTLRFQSGGGAENAVIMYGPTWRSNIHLSDLCIDGALAALYGINMSGYGADGWTAERVWFKDCLTAGALIQQSRNPRFKDCVFSTSGDFGASANGNMLGLQCVDSVRGLRVQNCDFDWCYQGVLIDSGTNREIVSRQPLIESSKFRNNFWLIKPYANANATGSGGTVTYTSGNGISVSGTLVDTSKDFTQIPADSFRAIRALPVVATGTTTNIAQLILEDSLANFGATGVLYGDIVRVPGKWAMVVKTVPGFNNRLLIDGWIDNTTYQPVAGPNIGTAYTVHRVYMGEMYSRTATTIVTPRWRDLLGNTVTPPNGCLYEILGRRSVGHIHFEGGAEEAVVADCFLEGDWSDQCSLRGYGSRLENVTARYGQDGGATLEGDHTSVNGGVFAYNGAAGLFLVSGRIAVHGAEFLDNGTEYIVSDLGCNVHLVGGDGHTITGSRLRRVSAPNCNYGVILRGATGCNVEARFEGHALAPVKYEVPDTRTRFRFL
jgi:hypothetical protein